MAEPAPKSLPHIDNATELAFERTRAALQYKRVGALIGVLCFLVVASLCANVSEPCTARASCRCAVYS